MTTDRSRRQFFTTAVAAAAWASVWPRSGVEAHPLAATPAAPLKLGVASYSMREFSLDQALEMAKTLGVTRMTFKDVHIPRTDPPEATRALRAKIEAAGITIMGGGTITIPNNPAQIEKEFVYAKNAGFPLIYVDPEPAALDTIESLHPRAVIAGHKRPGNDDGPRIIEETRQYIRAFDRLAETTTTARELYDQMLSLYPERVNPGALWSSARAFKPEEGKTA